MVWNLLSMSLVIIIFAVIVVPYRLSTLLVGAIDGTKAEADVLNIGVISIYVLILLITDQN